MDTDSAARAVFREVVDPQRNAFVTEPNDLTDFSIYRQDANWPLTFDHLDHNLRPELAKVHIGRTAWHCEPSQRDRFEKGRQDGVLEIDPTRARIEPESQT